MAYADRYSCNGTQCRSFSYTSFSSDCTNSASQVLHAVGQPYLHQTIMNADASRSPYIQSWNTVSGFLSYRRGFSAYYTAGSGAFRNLGIGALRLHGRDNIAEATRGATRDMQRPFTVLGITA